MSIRRQQEGDALSETVKELRSVGVRGAFDRAMKILGDDRAPATAHAQVIRSIFTAAGLGAEAAERPVKAIHEMSAAELELERDRLLSELRKRPGDEDAGETGEIFD